MSWLKNSAVALFVATGLLSLVTPSAFAMVETSAVDVSAPNIVVAAASEDKMSETDKRAKAVECSKQADAKKLHGEARKKFRSACKSGK